MKILKFWLFFLFTFSVTLWAENLDNLLQVYKKESDLSKVTKRESAGEITLYTRDQLEKMQAKNLMDVLKTVPWIYAYRGANGLILMTPPTLPSLPTTAVRLYINDHDMTSSSFGSAMLIWGEMPTEYIDHIEIYKVSSSIEFGNESGVFVIRVYTKQAARDSGSKVRALADQKGSWDLNLYTSNVLDNGLSYFAYANGRNYKREPYYNTYNNQQYIIKNDLDGYNLYANLNYKTSTLEIGNLHKRSDSFLGNGIHKTPTGGELNANHLYAHFTQKMPYDIKLQLAYDRMSYERSYIDPNGISIADPTRAGGRGIVNDYDIDFEDEVYSAIVEKRFNLDKHTITLGAFYKYKEMEQSGRYDALYVPRMKNGFSLYSIYAEEQYAFDDSTRFVMMAKGDFYRYKKEVDSADELIARAGVIKHIDRFHIKLFYTDTYLPNNFYRIYNPDNTPYSANPHLKHAQVKIGSASVEYLQNLWDVKLFWAQHRLKDGVVYRGNFVNADQTAVLNLFEISGHYRFDPLNTLYASVFTGNNDQDQLRSPKYGASMRLDDTFGKFDLYNEIRYTSSYTDSFYSIYIPYSLDWTIAGKYHFTKDLSIGLRGENLLDKSYRVVYSNYPDSIQTFDRKVWLNLEYLF